MPTREVPRWPARWSRAAWVLLGLGVASSAWGALAVAHGPGRLTTYAGHSGLAATLTIAAGAALGIAGLTLAFGGSPRTGSLALLAGLVWFAPVWVGWNQGPLLVRSVAMVAAGLAVPLLVHVVVGYPTGRLVGRAARVIVTLAYLESGLAAVVGALFRDPFFDPYCWSNCTGNVFVVQSLPDLARAVVVADRWATTGVAVALAGLCAWRVATASPPARRTLLPVAVPAVLLAAAVAARGVAFAYHRLEDPTEPSFVSAFIVQSSAIVLLAGALVAGLLRTRHQQQAVSRLASSMGEAPAPGSLEAALGRAVGDPALRISYWLPDAGRYVDGSGRSVEAPAAGPGRALTTLVRGDQRVAVVSHARGVPEIDDAMGPAFTLALDNERLQAQGLAQLEELRASRARIVETGDLERRRLERDLHDGAQQRLLSASYEIRLAASAATSAGDVHTASTLSDALDGSVAALEDLRELASGLFPAILTEAGLAAALMSLADVAPLTVDTRQVTVERLPAAVELAAYLLTVEAVDDADTRGASRVTVSMSRSGDRLLVVVEDDGDEPLAALVRSADRVGALGGTLELGRRVRRAEIPCA